MKYDHTGERFGRLTVLGIAPKESKGRHSWRVRCDCGTQAVVLGTRLRNGKTRSCGCLRKEMTATLTKAVHGHRGAHPGERETRSPTYNSWRNMKARCRPGNNGRGHYRYPEKGISVCERWQSFENFFADMGERPEGKTLDRIDNAKGYEPGNCRWATPREQVLNTQSIVWIEIDGVRKCLKDWATAYGVACSTVRRRLAAGWAPELAFIKPQLKQKVPHEQP